VWIQRIFASTPSQSCDDNVRLAASGSPVDGILSPEVFDDAGRALVTGETRARLTGVKRQRG
jgi:hypothetical protein